ncbi:MAG TPA: PepSY domain-containing protein [Phycisphaerae bacterium]|nr:PepSY domain-containing protein [Phycisphaerae bacterium]
MAAWRMASVVIGLGLLATSAMAAGEEGSELARVQAMVTKARITMAQAVETATKEVKDGRPYRAELQMEDGQPQYEVTMIAGAQRVEVEIDAVSGKVLNVEREEIEKTASHRWTFDKEPAGTLPPGWIIKQNNPTKALAKWTVEPDAEATSKPNVLNIKTENANATYNLALITTAVYKDLNVSVKIRGNTGADDQGGGLIWRCKDENNYYLCRINPIENNYRVYKVVDGKRTVLQSVDFETPAGQWFTLRVRMKGNEIACYCNGKKWLEVKDDTFKDAGMIGLWTKADACSSFDNLQAYPITGRMDGKEKEPAPGAAKQ